MAASGIPIDFRPTCLRHHPLEEHHPARHVLPANPGPSRQGQEPASGPGTATTRISRSRERQRGFAFHGTDTEGSVATGGGCSLRTAGLGRRRRRRTANAKRRPGFGAPRPTRGAPNAAVGDALGRPLRSPIPNPARLRYLRTRWRPVPTQTRPSGNRHARRQAWATTSVGDDKRRPYAEQPATRPRRGDPRGRPSHDPRGRPSHDPRGRPSHDPRVAHPESGTASLPTYAVASRADPNEAIGKTGMGDHKGRPYGLENLAQL